MIADIARVLGVACLCGCCDSSCWNYYWLITQLLETDIVATHAIVTALLIPLDTGITDIVSDVVQVVLVKLMIM